jgi:hypothetical protein
MYYECIWNQKLYSLRKFQTSSSFNRRDTLKTTELGLKKLFWFPKLRLKLLNKFRVSLTSLCGFRILSLTGWIFALLDSIHCFFDLKRTYLVFQKFSFKNGHFNKHLFDSIFVTFRYSYTITLFLLPAQKKFRKNEK